MLKYDGVDVLLFDGVQPRESGLLIPEELAGVVDEVQGLVLVHRLDYRLFLLPLRGPRCEGRRCP